jgi:outer membrane protein OmpA-like peptidoglycan-associated protein
MKQLKEAFRAKLERETFETRRLKSLRKLFRKGEVNIMANLDGSVLIRLSALKFAPGKSALDRKYFDLLRRLKQGLELYPDRKIVIEGHTDNQGDARANQRLSLKRAEGVRDFLVASGIPAGRLKALGYGEVRPIASNDYERGRAMNRRIDIIIQPPAKK